MKSSLESKFAIAPYMNHELTLCRGQLSSQLGALKIVEQHFRDTTKFGINWKGGYEGL